jgi:hypothetical protein
VNSTAVLLAIYYRVDVRLGAVELGQNRARNPQRAGIDATAINQRLCEGQGALLQRVELTALAQCVQKRNRSEMAAHIFCWHLTQFRAENRVEHNVLREALSNQSIAFRKGVGFSVYYVTSVAVSSRIRNIARKSHYLAGRVDKAFHTKNGAVFYLDKVAFPSFHVDATLFNATSVFSTSLFLHRSPPT